MKAVSPANRRIDSDHLQSMLGDAKIKRTSFSSKTKDNVFHSLPWARMDFSLSLARSEPFGHSSETAQTYGLQTTAKLAMGS